MAEEEKKIQAQIAKKQEAEAKRHQEEQAHIDAEAKKARDAEDAAKAARERADKEEAARLAREAADARQREEAARAAAAAAVPKTVEEFRSPAARSMGTRRRRRHAGWLRPFREGEACTVQVGGAQELLHRVLLHPLDEDAVDEERRGGADAEGEAFAEVGENP